MRRLREESGTNIQKFEFSKRLPIISTLSANMLSRCRPDNARRTSARAELKDVSPRPAAWNQAMIRPITVAWIYVIGCQAL